MPKTSSPTAALRRMIQWLTPELVKRSTLVVQPPTWTTLELLVEPRTGVLLTLATTGIAQATNNFGKIILKMAVTQYNSTAIILMILSM